MEYTIKQKAKIISQGPQYIINLRKEFHQKFEQKKLFNKALEITITFKTLD